jgi:short-subunit dehydrogenase
VFDKQCWWITGASSGIGRALAQALDKRGAHLILSGRNVEALDKLKSSCQDALVLPFEATDYDRLPQLAQQAWDWKGRVHGLVNNAGVSQRSLAIETSFEVYQRMIAIDLLAPIALAQQNLPRMVQAGGGRIVAISSVAGILGAPMRSACCAAKHGLIGYHDAVRAENEHLGIKVHVIAPGSVRTDVSRNAMNADGSRRGVSDAVIDNGLPPEDAAQQILKGIEAEKRELILATGTELDIALLRRKDPEALFERMSAMVRDGYAKRMAAEKKAS